LVNRTRHDEGHRKNDTRKGRAHPPGEAAIRPALASPI
jgi:hypothetical protein